MLLIDYVFKLQLGVVISPTVLGGSSYGLLQCTVYRQRRIRGVYWSKRISSNDLMIQASCNVGQLELSMLGTRIALMWVTDMPVMPLFYLFLTLKLNISPPCVVCKSNTHLGSSTFNFHLVSLTSSS